jgi:hypothetical protein
MRLRCQGGQEADRRQQGVDAVDPGRLADLIAHGRAAGQTLAGRTRGEVDRELRGQRADQQVGRRFARRRRAGKGQDQRGPEREPSVAGRHRDAADRSPAANHFGELRRGEGDRHEQRNDAWRKHEEHRHEDGLGGERVAARHVELHARGDDQRERQQYRFRGVECALARREDRQRQGRRDHPAARDDLHDSLAVAERLGVALVRSFEVLLRERRRLQVQCVGNSAHGVAEHPGPVRDSYSLNSRVTVIEARSLESGNREPEAMNGFTRDGRRRSRAGERRRGGRARSVSKTH